MRVSAPLLIKTTGFNSRRTREKPGYSSVLPSAPRRQVSKTASRQGKGCGGGTPSSWYYAHRQEKGLDGLSGPYTEEAQGGPAAGEAMLHFKRRGRASSVSARRGEARRRCGERAAAPASPPSPPGRAPLAEDRSRPRAGKTAAGRPRRRGEGEGSAREASGAGLASSPPSPSQPWPSAHPGVSARGARPGLPSPATARRGRTGQRGRRRRRPPLAGGVGGRGAHRGGEEAEGGGGAAREGENRLRRPASRSLPAAAALPPPPPPHGAPRPADKSLNNGSAAPRHRAAVLARAAPRPVTLPHPPPHSPPPAAPFPPRLAPPLARGGRDVAERGRGRRSFP